MVSNQQLLARIEQHVTKAKNATDELRLRDDIVAIKTLCELFLAKDQAVETVASIASTVQAVPTQTALHVSGHKIEEDDANGHSIFDF